MRWFILFLGIVLISIGILVANSYLRDRSLSLESLNWPTTEGVITESKVVTSKSRNLTSYYPYVRYEYRVNGKEFWNCRTQLGGRMESERHQVVLQHAVGDTVPVYYQITNPQTSLLIRGGGGVSLWIVRPVAALTLGLLGLLFLKLGKSMEGY